MVFHKGETGVDCHYTFLCAKLGSETASQFRAPDNDFVKLLRSVADDTQDEVEHFLSRRAMCARSKQAFRFALGSVIVELLVNVVAWSMHVV